MTASVNRSCYCSDDCWQAACPHCSYRTRHNFTAEDAAADVARHIARNHPEGTT